MTTVLSEETKSRMKVGYVARRVPRSALYTQLAVPVDPSPGDVVLARVEKIGKNTSLENVDGRRCTLHEGDLVVVAFGNRYATLQFEGYARSQGDRCDLLSMGGLCGLVESKHDSVADPSKLRILGAIGDETGNPVRLADHALAPALSPRQVAPKVIGVCGTSMDAGKTYTVRSSVLGLRQQGLRVAAIKLTGTASGRDKFSMLDAGATPALDFIDAGYPSTYLCSLKELMDIYGILLSQATAQRADCVVIEIADGLVQRETTALMTNPRFTGSVRRKSRAGTRCRCLARRQMQRGGILAAVMDDLRRKPPVPGCGATGGHVTAGIAVIKRKGTARHLQPNAVACGK